MNNVKGMIYAQGDTTSYQDSCPFKWFVLDFVGHYATNPFRIAGTMIMTVVAFVRKILR